ncbi:MAG: SUMF1/EgtB/PvdO family nonheme iron enzyme [Verrucomicrobia bacterium]|nr:SUMF1/EgtB/PvdO family nonheme iron enzyme [Verrucomicrobiota bacterium]
MKISIDNIPYIRNRLAMPFLLLLFSIQSLMALEMVVVGDPGNSRENNHMTSSLGNVNASEEKPGAVDYAFRMSAHEVTNSDYAEFLNAKAKTDLAYYRHDNAEKYDSDTFFRDAIDGLPVNLYDTAMGSSPHGGIVRSGIRGEFVYTVKPGFENKPVNFVNKLDAQRYCNWLTNGKGNGDTETGVYVNLGDSNSEQNAFLFNTIPADSSGREHRNAEAWAKGGYALPNGDEWAKAAYYDPEKGENGGYWEYPTRSATTPSASEGNFDISGIGTVVDVGQYPSNGAYGIYDLAGNVCEWLEDSGNQVANEMTMTWDHPLDQIYYSGVQDTQAVGRNFDSGAFNSHYNRNTRKAFLLIGNANTGFRVVQGMKAVERWRHGHFDGDYETTAIAGNQADPDNDGVANLLEYAQNLDPNDGTDGATGLGIETSGGAPSLLYRKNTDATDVNYQIEQTDDLSAPNWQAAELGAQTIINEAGNTLELRAPTTGSAASERFYRIRVEQE